MDCADTHTRRERERKEKGPYARTAGFTVTAQVTHCLVTNRNYLTYKAVDFLNLSLLCKNLRRIGRITALSFSYLKSS